MPTHENQNWYYTSANGERQGPVALDELASLASQGVVTPVTLVWCQGYPDWIAAEKITDLLNAVRLEPNRVSSDPPTLTSVIPLELKPRAGSFIFPRILISLFVSGVFGTTAAAALLVAEQPPLYGLAVFVVGIVLGAASSMVAYRKERYQFSDTRVICHRGGLVSDQSTEFEIRNITHVKIRLPWLRHMFFGVGDVIVETAGNAQPVVLRVIRDPEAICEGLRERMKKNGYDLTQQQLLHEEKPAIIGIVGDCFGLIAGAVFSVIFFFPGLLTMIRDVENDSSIMWIGVGVGIVGIIFLSYIVIHFLDLRRRSYRVYTDVVIYQEGFLTRKNAFIPYENIADSDTKCSLFARIFGLHDVRVSCQGNGAEIRFRHLRNGVALSAAIDQLVVLAGQKKKSLAAKASGNPSQESSKRLSRKEPEDISIGEILVGDFKMSGMRTLIPLLFLFPIFPVWIIVMIQAVIRLAFTLYAVRAGTLRHSFRFVSVHEREFAYDKITGLVIKQNLWDHMFGTLTLRFWSLGSGQPLEFSNVHQSQIDLPALMRQAGIPAASSDPYEAMARFGVLTWLRAKTKLLPILVIFVLGIVAAAEQLDERIYYLLTAPALLAMIGLVYGKLYYARQRLRFHQHHVEAEQGIIAKKRYYARYRNIKRSRATRYPGGQEGELEIFVAGEEAFQAESQQKNTQKLGMKPCSFTTGYLPEVKQLSQLLDDVLCGRVAPSAQAVAADPLRVLLDAKRSVGNAITRLFFISIILFPLIPLLPLTIPLCVIRVKRYQYRIDAARIVMNWGIFYRSESSILLDRVDSQQQSQGVLNKLFKNGNVHIMTAGSSKPDMGLIETPAYLAIYEVIRERTQ